MLACGSRGCVSSLAISIVPPLQGCGLATFADHQSAADAILALDGVYMWPNFHDPMVSMTVDKPQTLKRRWALVLPVECSGSHADSATQWQARHARRHKYA
jgi:hypothetical protein